MARGNPLRASETSVMTLVEQLKVPMTADDKEYVDYVRRAYYDYNSETKYAQQRIERLKEILAENAPDWSGRDMAERQLKSAERRLAKSTADIEKAEKIVKRVEKGKMAAIMPAYTKRESAVTFGVKMLAARMLLAKGLKAGPDRSEVTDEQLFNMVNGDMGRESLITFDSKGRFVGGISGAESSIRTLVPYKMLAGNPHGYTNPGGSDFHNHPRQDGRVYGFGPSGNDVRGLIHRGLASRTIGSKEGTYTIGISPQKRAEIEAKNEISSFAKFAGKTWKVMFMNLQNHVGSGAFTNPNKADETLKLSIERMKTMASSLGLDFKYTPSEAVKHLFP